MKTTTSISTAALLSLSLLEGTAAFAPEQRPAPAVSSNPTVHVAAPVEDRRAFVGGVISAAFGAAAFSNTPAAWADDEEKVEDLAMPSADEEKALDDAAMAERLKRKAELQKKMSRPMNYKDSMDAEKSRQKDMKKSKAEMRAALCEELGRGC